MRRAHRSPTVITMNLPEQSPDQIKDEKKPTEQSPRGGLRQSSRHVFELVLFAMLGTLMFCSKLIMEVLPNIHLLALFITVFTVTFRQKALIPLYVFVFLTGLYGGFNLWWMPYLYIWTLLWAVIMLLPKRMPRGVAYVVYPIVCAIHGFLYGILYAPAQALLFHLDFPQTVAWILSGLPFDIIHGVSNFFVAFLTIPLSDLLKKAIRGR